jgi:hypothetical protein
MATTDDVLNLLKAVNETTLKRMEDFLHSINKTTLGRIESEIKLGSSRIVSILDSKVRSPILADHHATIEDRIFGNSELLKRIEKHLQGIEKQLKDVNEITLKRMEETINLIKLKVDTL